jgi:hypothetical protein
LHLLFFFRTQQGLALKDTNHQSSSSTTYRLLGGSKERQREREVEWADPLLALQFPASLLSFFLFSSSLSPLTSIVILFFSFQKAVDSGMEQGRLGVLLKRGIRAPLLVDFNVLTLFSQPVDHSGCWCERAADRFVK